MTKKKNGAGVASKKKWLIMVYLAGDNPLNEDMATAISDINENYQMLQNYKFAVYFDNGTPLFNTKQYYFDTPLGDPPKDLGEGDAADPKSVEEFVEWSVTESKSYDPDYYALIMAGHGDGFQSYSFMRDENPLGAMPITATSPGTGPHNSLREVLEKQLLPGGKKLDILAFDTCVMATFEVAYELRKTANIMVASQGYVPITGWSYLELIKRFERNEANNKLSPTSTAKAMMKAYMTYSRRYAKLVGRSTDISAIQLGMVEQLKDSINRLAALLNVFPDPPPPKGKPKREVASVRQFRAILEKTILLSHLRSQTFLFEQCVDIVDFCKSLASECDYFRRFLTNASERKLFKDIKDECDKIENLVRAFTIDPCFKGPEYQFGNGVSLFCPWSFTSYKLTKQKYDSFEFAAKSGVTGDDRLPEPWSKFLENFLSHSERGPVNSTARGVQRVDPTSGRPRGDFSSQIEKFGGIKNFSLAWNDIP